MRTLLVAFALLVVLPTEASALTEFVTPRRAAYCGTSHAPPVRLICWTPNDGFTTSMSPRGRASKRYLRENRGYHDPAPQRVLRFGQTMRLGREFRCTSRADGLTCRNLAGHGWWLGRFVGYRLF